MNIVFCTKKTKIEDPVALQLIECVPNFSEGRDSEKIDRIAKAIQSEDVRLLHVDPGWDANRTVMTFVGSPDAVLEAAFQGIRVASEVIDMRNQKGEHPRLGATDVCPFVPFQNTTMDECIQLSKELGKRVGRELGIPVYLYNRSAQVESRIHLSQIRKGEYEGLEKKMTHLEWQSDFGPTTFNARSGATVIGARNFLIAYNINLATQDVTIAQAIAGKIRESGIIKRDAYGLIIKDNLGKPVREPGLFKACKAIGWKMECMGYTQISTNLTDMYQTLPHQIFEACKKLAAASGTAVTGSELVGMIPQFAMQQAGKFYADFDDDDDFNLILIAAKSMGLSQISPFIPEKRILEWAYFENQDVII